MWFLECCHKHLNFTQYQDTPEQYRLIRKKKIKKKMALTFLRKRLVKNSETGLPTIDQKLIFVNCIQNTVYICIYQVDYNRML